VWNLTGSNLFGLTQVSQKRFIMPTSRGFLYSPNAIFQHARANRAIGKRVLEQTAGDTIAPEFGKTRQRFC
jgi:hypothetical protein